MRCSRGCRPSEVDVMIIGGANEDSTWFSNLTAGPSSHRLRVRMPAVSQHWGRDASFLILDQRQE